VRLTGPDPELVYVHDEPEAAAAPADEAYSARITLRLPEALKSALETAASREGVSVNTWIVRALSRSSTAAPAAQPGNRLTGYARG
jgi:predicted HicB family RNase H-like nuclease